MCYDSHHVEARAIILKTPANHTGITFESLHQIQFWTCHNHSKVFVQNADTSAVLHGDCARRLHAHGMGCFSIAKCLEKFPRMHDNFHHSVSLSLFFLCDTCMVSQLKLIITRRLSYGLSIIMYDLWMICPSPQDYSTLPMLPVRSPSYHLQRGLGESSS